MRMLRMLLIAFMFILLPAAAMQTPTSTQAAPIFAGQSTITGRLVAVQSGNLGIGTYLVQAGGRTFLVRVTAQTQVIDRNGSPLTLSALHDRDQVKVTGYFKASQGTATLIQDFSVQVSVNVVLKGELIAVPSPAFAPPSALLCLSNTVITSTSAPNIRAQIASPCPSGLLPVYITDNTRFENQDGGRVSLSALRANDLLQVTGVLANGRFTASVVKDLSLEASVSIQVKGQLVAVPNPATVPPSGILCLASTVVTSNSRPGIRAQIVSPCPSGDLPIYLNSNTHIRDQANNAATLANLQANDILLVTGSLINGQIVASVVKDLTIHIQVNLTTVTGTLVAAPASTDLSSPVSLLVQVGGQTLLVRVSNQTQIIDNNGSALGLGSLHTGDTLQVTGVASTNQIDASLVKDTSQPAAVSVTVTGQLALAPSPATTPPSGVLCLANSSVTSANTPQIHALTVSPCPSGDLPVYLNGNTALQDHNGAAIVMLQLRAGDTLKVAGTLANGQVTASLVQDASL
jgi:hypothetical protein